MMRHHSTDIVSFGFGAVFLAAGSLLLSDRLNLLTDLRWAVPALLIVVALALIGSVLGQSRAARSAHGGGATPPLDEMHSPGPGD